MTRKEFRCTKESHEDQDAVVVFMWYRPDSIAPEVLLQGDETPPRLPKLAIFLTSPHNLYAKTRNLLAIILWFHALKNTLKRILSYSHCHGLF
jgi:hypothetical protein